MRDTRKNGKRRDLRRATRSWWSFTAFDLYEKLYPQPPYLWREYGWAEWHRWHNARDQWVYEQFGLTWGDCGPGSIPAELRRDQNRLHRCREKAALRRAVQLDDFDNFIMPRPRRNIRWLYW